jgi:hypothetical protein
MSRVNKYYESEYWLVRRISNIRMRPIMDKEVRSKLVVSLIMLQQCCSVSSKSWSYPLAASISNISELVTHYFGNIIKSGSFLLVQEVPEELKD